MAPHTPPSLSSLAQMLESIERTAHLSSNQWQGGYHVSTWVGSSHHSSSFIRIPNPQSPSLSPPSHLPISHLPSPPHLLLAAAAIADAAAAASTCPSFRSSLTTACRCRGAISRVLSLKQRVCVEGSITRDPTVHRRPLPNSAQKEGGGGGGGTYSQRLGIHPVLNHGDADGQGAPVEVAVLPYMVLVRGSVFSLSYSYSCSCGSICSLIRRVGRYAPATWKSHEGCRRPAGRPVVFRCGRRGRAFLRVR